MPTPTPITTNAIALQLKEIRASKSGRLDNRNRYIYWQTPSGQWKKKLNQPGTRSVNSKAPTGKYRGKKGEWRDARRKNKRTEPPFKFAPVKVPRRSGLKNADAAIDRTAEIFSELTSNSWSATMLPPIEPRKAAHPLGGVAGTVVGWRIRFVLRVDGKSNTIHEEMAAALLEMREDNTVMRAFGGQLSRAMMMYTAVDSNGVEGTYTGSAARVFQTMLKQAASHLIFKGAEYPDWRLTGAHFFLQ
jgi:hypothetical protein